MDLMKLAAKITLDDSSYRQGVSNAEKMGQQLAGKMSAMTVAVGNIAADMIKKAAAAVKSVVDGAVQGYADYQQLIGGVETLFKQSSNRVAKYAKESFRTTGLSANDYMETVTSFSASLLQGLKGNTEAAADVANMAVIDMADNANKMGSDIGTIQQAYMGFAKQNYTMLDNLKLGYGGTASEMIRLVNDSKVLGKEIDSLDGVTFDQLVKAIHTVQDEMGVTGTTAKEAASTISGSKASLKAAWADLLATVGGEGDKTRMEEVKKSFKAAFDDYVKNLAPTVQTTIENAPELIAAVTDAVKSIPSKAISQLVAGGVDIATAIFKGGADVAGWLIDGLAQMFEDLGADDSKIEELGESIGNFIATAMKKMVTNAPKFIAGLFNMGVELAEGLIEGLYSGLFGTNDGLPEMFKDMDKETQDAIKKTIKTSTEAEGVLGYMQSLVDKYGEAAKNTDEFKRAQQELNELLPDAPEWMKNYNGSLQDMIDKYKEFNTAQREAEMAEIRKRALQDKQNAVYDARAALLTQQSELEIAQWKYQESKGNLLDFFGLYEGIKNSAGATVDTSLDPNASKDQIMVALQGMLQDAFGGTGNQAFDNAMAKWNTPEGQAQVDAWIESMKKNGSEATKLEEGMASLQTQLDEVTKDYDLSAAAIEALTSAAGSARNALYAISNPETTMNSGQYYNWLYGGKGRPGFATGIDWVPEDNLRATLHRGEAVLTKQEADEYRNGGGNAALIGELQALRNDMRNLKLVVGEKTFGRAVVDYSGRRVDGYIGGTESRRAAGFGA